MAYKKPVSWFLTSTGRKFSFSVVTAAGLSLTTAKYAPHTFFLQKYKDFVHHYRNGQPVQLPDHLQERYQKCLDILNAPDMHRKLIAPFSVFGYDLFHAGSTNSKFGAAVGIPVNFTYNSIQDVQSDEILVNQKKIDWNSEVGRQLANALVLPEKVQQFAICREILMTQNNKVILDSVYPFSCIFMCYTFCQYLNHKFNLYAAHPSVRATLYTLVALFGAGTYFLLKDVTEVYYETEVDKKLCELGEDFIASGVIFYQKLLERNQALRELMGREGHKKYSAMGNENFVLRQPRIALVHRKQFFEEKLNEYLESKVIDNEVEDEILDEEEYEDEEEDEVEQNEMSKVK